MLFALIGKYTEIMGMIISQKEEYLKDFQTRHFLLILKKNGRIENSHTKCIGHGGLKTPIDLHDIQIDKSKGHLSCNGDLLPGKNKSLTYDPFLLPFTFSSAYIKHIFTKSTEEWYKYKMRRHVYGGYGWNNFNMINKFYPNKPYDPSQKYTFIST